MQEEVEIECPFCGETITVLVDVSVESQNYIEDCAVCCKPIQLDVQCADDQLVSIHPARS